jgi:chemotaxis family two-component system response regulator Rcp1
MGLISLIQREVRTVLTQVPAFGFSFVRRIVMPETLPNRTEPVHILLAEDDLADANLTLEIFKKSNFPLEIERVKDGVEALAYLRQQGPYARTRRPDLILLDLNMPRLGGLEVLDEVKRDPQLEAIPVLILTCSKSDMDRIKAYESKANFFAVKPSDLEQFFEFIKYLEDYWLKGLRSA